MSTTSGGSLHYLGNHMMVDLSPNVALADSSAATPIIRLVAPGLVTLGYDLSIQPELAESWTISEDRRIYTFRLREGLRFHSGRPVDAAVVAWNFEHIFDPRVVSHHAFDYRHVERVVPVDARTVEFHLTRPFEPLLQWLTWRTGIKDDCATQPVGAGPFMLAEFRADGDGYLRLVKNPHYWRTGYPLLDEIEVRFAPDASSRARAIQSGYVDVAESVPSGIVEDLVASGRFAVHRLPGFRRQFLAMNCVESPFSDVRVRQACAFAIDKQRIVRDVLAGYAQVAETPLPPESPFHCPMEPRSVDRDKARQLLAGAGYGPGQIDLPLHLSAVSPAPRIATLIVQDLAEIGIILRPTTYPDPPWWPFVYLNTPWKIALQGSAPRTEPDLIFARDYRTGGPFNPMRYSNPTFDDLIERAAASADYRSRKVFYDEAQRILVEELPMIELFHADVTCGWKPAVGGLRPHPRGDLSFTETYINR